MPAYPPSSAASNNGVRSISSVAGDLSLNFTDSTWRAVNGSTWDLIVPAVTGDVVKLSVAIRVQNGNNTGFDFCTMVSASPVNRVSDGAAFSSSAGGGFGGMFHQSGLAAAGTGKSATAFYTVVAGDISGGNVTFRLYYRNISGSGANSAPLVDASVGAGSANLSAETGYTPLA